MTIHIKYPPGGDQGHVPEGWSDARDLTWTHGIEAEYADANRKLSHCKSSFERDGNPIYALEALRLAHSVGVYPPLWALEFVNERFAKALREHISLDRAFGFEQPGSGRHLSPQEKDRVRARNITLAKNVFKLEGAGLSRSAACNALSSLLARLPAGVAIGWAPWETKVAGVDLTGKAIEAAVKSVEQDLGAEKAATLEASKAWTPDQVDTMLRIFNANELPNSLARVGTKRKKR